MRSIEATRSARRSSVDTWLGRMLPSEESALVEILLVGGVKRGALKAARLPGWWAAAIGSGEAGTRVGGAHCSREDWPLFWRAHTPLAGERTYLNVRLILRDIRGLERSGRVIGSGGSLQPCKVNEEVQSTAAALVLPCREEIP